MYRDYKFRELDLRKLYGPNLLIQQRYLEDLPRIATRISSDVAMTLSSG